MSKFSCVRFLRFVVGNSLTVVYFPYLFPRYYSICPYTVTAVTSLPFAFLIKASSSPHIDASTLSWMLASPLPSSFLSFTYNLCHLLDVKHCVSSSTFLSTGPFVLVLPLPTLGMVPSILQREQSMCLSFWWNFCRRVGFKKLSRLYEILLSFLSSLLV